MGHLHTRIKGIQSTKEKPPDTDLEEKIKMYCFEQVWTLVQPKKEISNQIHVDVIKSIQAGGTNTSM